MILATGFATVEDFETGEQYEKYRVVYETHSKRKLLEVLEWFAESKYKKVLVVPDTDYTKKASLRSMFAERMREFEQPEDGFVSVVMKYGRVYLEKS